MLGQLVPVGGGDPIPLLKPELLVGRRNNCDIILSFLNAPRSTASWSCSTATGR